MQKRACRCGCRWAISSMPRQQGGLRRSCRISNRCRFQHIRVCLRMQVARGAKSAAKGAQAAAKKAEKTAEKKSGGFLSALGIGQETVYADED